MDEGCVRRDVLIDPVSLGSLLDARGLVFLVSGCLAR